MYFISDEQKLTNLWKRTRTCKNQINHAQKIQIIQKIVNIDNYPSTFEGKGLDDRGLYEKNNN